MVRNVARHRDRDDILQRLSTAVRQGRNRKGWGQAELAEKLKVKRPAISRLETAELSPSLVLFKDLCVLLSISPAEVLGLQGRPFMEVAQETLRKCSPKST